MHWRRLLQTAAAASTATLDQSTAFKLPIMKKGTVFLEQPASPVHQSGIKFPTIHCACPSLQLAETLGDSVRKRATENGACQQILLFVIRECKDTWSVRVVLCMREY
jgi:hypothetical protein